jgi:hypothetical protein
MMGLIDSFWTKTNELANSALSSVPISNVKNLLGTKANKPTTSGVAGGSTDPHLQNRKYTIRIYQNSNVVVGAVPDALEINQSASWNAPWAGGISGAKGDIMAVGLGTRLVAQVLTLQVWQGGGNNDFDFSIQFELRAYADPERDVMIPLRTLLNMTVPSLSSNGFLQAPGPRLTQEGIKKLGAGVAAVAVKTGEVVVDAAKAGYKVATGEMKNGGIGSITDSAANAVNQIGTTAKEAGLTRKGIEANMENKIKIEIGDWFRMTNVIVTDVKHTMKPQRPGPAGTIMAADVMISFRPMFTVTAEDIEMILGQYKG